MRKDNSKQQIQIITSKDEMNLVEFPFILLSKRNEDQKTIEFTDWTTANGETAKREWIVTGSDKFGLPTASDEELYIALMKVSKDMDFQSRRVPIVRYQLAKLMGWRLDGKSYERIEQGLDRLSGVRIKAKNAFWDNEKKKYVTVNFGVIDDYYLYDEKPGKKRDISQEELPISNFSWNEVLFNSFKAGNIKTIDAEFYFTLKNPITKRLYRFLDKKKYGGKPKFEIGIRKLASLLPLKDDYPSHIKVLLEKAHNELTENGFLSNVDYEKAKGGEEKIVYRFHGKLSAKGKTDEPKKELFSQGKGNVPMLQCLEERGITKRVARTLVSNYLIDQIQTQIGVFDWLKRNKSPLVSKNPAGFLCKAIEENYQPPKEYLNQQNRKNKEQRKEDRQERWLKHREELIKQDITNWDKVPLEKRIEGRLGFWITGETMNGRTSTPEQIEIKKKELIDSLPKTDDEKWEYLAQNYSENPPDDFR
jgi:hypothetical protein